MKTILSMLAISALTAVSFPASANTNGTSSQPTILTHSAAPAAGLQVARRGADDPASHDVNDDRGGARSGKGRGGHDDGPNHA